MIHWTPSKKTNWSFLKFGGGADDNERVDNHHAVTLLCHPFSRIVEKCRLPGKHIGATIHMNCAKQIEFWANCNGERQWEIYLPFFQPLALLTM